jgi:subtilisin family serine protease
LVVAALIALILVVPGAAAPAAVAAQADPGFWIPNDPYFHDQWALFNFGQSVGGGPRGTRNADIRAPEAWSITTGSRDVVVAVVDSGVAYDHPDLAPNIWLNEGELGNGRETNGIDDDGNGYVDDFRGWDFVDNDNDPRDSRTYSLQSRETMTTHGTVVAAPIAAVAHDGFGMAGVAPNVRIMAVRAASRVWVDSDLADAIAYAVTNGADIVNLSFGSWAAGFGPVAAVAQIKAAAGTLFVTIAHNQGKNADVAKVEPCIVEVPHLICVAATDRNDHLATFAREFSSNFGSVGVDLAAPGGEILTAVPASKAIATESFDEDLSAWETSGPGDWPLVDAEGGTAAELTTTGASEERTEHWLRSRTPVDLSGQDDCLLTFEAATALRPGDVFALAISTDGTTWIRQVGQEGFNLSGETELADHVALLDKWRGESQVYIGFVLDRRPGEAESRVWLDNLEVSCASSDYQGDEFEFVGGTSFAAPITAGVAALILSEHPSLTPEQVKEAILAGVDLVPALAGWVATGGRLNAYNALLAAERIAAGETVLPPRPDPDAASSTGSSPLPVWGAMPDYGDLPPPGLPVPTSRDGRADPPEDPCPSCAWLSDTPLLPPEAPRRTPAD